MGATGILVRELNKLLNPIVEQLDRNTRPFVTVECKDGTTNASDRQTSRNPFRTFIVDALFCRDARRHAPLPYVSLVDELTAQRPAQAPASWSAQLRHDRVGMVHRDEEPLVSLSGQS